MVTKDLAFEKRYAENWTPEFRRGIHQSVNGVCVHCKKAKSVEIHHAHYKDRHGAIAGREKPGVDVFPLCQRCHGVAHSSKNWVKDKVDPVLGNRNTDEFLKQLKADWANAVGGKVRRTNFPGWVRWGAAIGAGLLGLVGGGFWWGVAGVGLVLLVEVTG